jgi:hypothetical protein
MGVLFLGFIFALVLMACLIGVSMLNARDVVQDPHAVHRPSVSDTDALPPPPRHGEANAD